MTKTLERLKAHNTELRYATYVEQAISMIGPKNLRLIAGRGTAKTTGVIASRSIEIIHDMPRSLQAFVSDTFVNARTNIVPTLIEGWREYNGWREGVHYVVDERPPSSFGLPYKPVSSFKNTISTFNGATILVGSLDQPSGLAGNSFQHVYGDEAKYLDKKRLDVLMPALRGYNKFAHSPFYRGTTFTTDLPNISKNDYDWILDTESQMDIQKITAALQVAMVINEINIEILTAYNKRKFNVIPKLVKQRERWMLKWYRARKNTTFFYVVSSMVNVDILTPGYIYDNLETLGWEEFKQSVLSFKSKLEEGDRFYTGLGQHHFYQDGILNDYVQSFGIKDDFKATSRMLRYIDHNAPLECGVDFGKMISMVIGQEIGPYFYCLKNLFTLVPESSKELGVKFRDFFAPHGRKELYMYYDRSGNQYASNGRDWATEVKNAIEFDENGKRTGWNVRLMSKEQSTIYQSQEYFLMKQVLQETVPGLPKVKIDTFQCKELKSSMELAKIYLHTDPKTMKKTIQKDKTSEKLSLLKLPMQSTNMSDAAKYLFYRKKWAEFVKAGTTYLPTGLDGLA